MERRIREVLSLCTVSPENLYLDPNNPRFFELGIRRRRVPEERIVEDGVQESTLEALIRHFDVRSLRDSILQAGFLPVDKIVARPLTQKNKYVVVEGNRRLAAIKWILRDCKSGELTLSDDDLKRLGLKELEVYVMQVPEREIEAFRLMLQGIRHVSGVKGWKAYARAQAVVSMLNMGLTPQAVGEALGGLRPSEVIRYKRAYYAYKQMTEDEQYGRVASDNPEWLSYFDEAVKSEYLRNWLGWNDNELKFTNEENLRMFYRWIVPPEEGGEGKITGMRDVRKLPRILAHPRVSQFFINDPDVTVDIAMGRLEAIELRVDWRVDLHRALEILERHVSLPFEKSDAELLESLIQVAKQRLKEIRRIIKKTRERSK